MPAERCMGRFVADGGRTAQSGTEFFFSTSPGQRTMYKYNLSHFEVHHDRQ